MTKFRWSHELILTELNKMVVDLDLKVMPTRTQVDDYFGNTRLSNAISKKCGWYNLAREVGLKIKPSESTTGLIYENKVNELLISMGYETIKMTQNHPFDILVNNVKVDVKSSNLGRYRNGSFYSFRMGKRYSACDIFIMVAINEFKEEKIFVIPSKFIMDKVQISIGEINSVYNVFIDRFDLLDEHIKFIDELSTD